MGSGKKPSHLWIGNEKFVPAVFRVESFDEQGRPERLTHVPHDRTVELSRDKNDNHFLIVYANEKSIAPNPELANHGQEGGVD